MALSGSFKNMPTSIFGLYCTWSAKQSATGNYSNVTLKVYLKYYSLYVGSRSGSKISINGVTESYTAPAISEGTNSPHTKLLKTKTVRVNHNSNGTKTNVPLFASWRFDGSYGGKYIGTITASTKVNLNTIDRTAPTVTFKTSNVTVGGFTISAYSSASSDTWQYSLNGGSSWASLSSVAGTSASKVITGLAPNTSYSVRVRARKRSNYVYGYATTQAVKTLGGAVLSGVSTFTADDSEATINFSATAYDPSYTYTLKIKNGESEYLSIPNISLSVGTSARSIVLTESQRNTLLNEMARIKSFTGTFLLYSYNGSVQIGPASSKAATVQTTDSNSGPIFSEFNCLDSNPVTTEVTGNSIYFIEKFSDLSVTPTEATPRNGTSIISYTVTCNGKAASSFAAEPIDLGKILKSGEVEVSVKVTDSRGYTKSISKTIIVAPYLKPKISSSTLRRTNEIETEMQLNFEGSFSAILVENIMKNSLQSARYRYKKTSEENFGDYIDILEGVVVNSTNFAFENKELCYLDSDFSYDFHLEVMDKLETLELYFIVPQGTPLIALRKKKVGINNPKPTAALDVYGEAKVDGGKVWHGKNLEIQVGRHTFTDITANVTAEKEIVFDVPFSSPPSITGTAYTAYPQDCDVGISDVSNTKFILTFNRKTEVSTIVCWQAIAII